MIIQTLFILFYFSLVGLLIYYFLKLVNQTDNNKGMKPIVLIKENRNPIQTANQINKQNYGKIQKPHITSHFTRTSGVKRMFKKLISILFLFIIMNSDILAQDSVNINLADLVRQALESNPQLKASNYQYLGSQTKIKQVNAWDAPQIGIEFFQTPIQSFPNPIRNNMETDYFIQQMIPFPGKIKAMGESAFNSSKMYEEQYNTLKNNIIKELKTAFYELYLVQRRIEINNENQDLLRQFVEIATKQYQVGMGKQTDIIRAQTELSSLVNDGINLLKTKRDAETMINTILNQQPDKQLGNIAKIIEDIPQFTFNELYSLAIQNRPELRGMNYNIEMYRSELKASKLEYYPDLMVRLMYKNMADTRDDFWSTMVGVNIPIAFWSNKKYSGKIEENELNIKTAQEQYNFMVNMVSYNVQSALVKLETSRNQLNLNRNTVIPQAEQTLHSTIAAYRTGKTEFLMLIDAYRMLLMTKLEYYMSEMNVQQANAQLEQAVGISMKEIIEKAK